MKNILLIGVGGTGSNAVDIFYQKYNELGNQTQNNITALVFDTDAGDLKKISAARTVAMSDTASVGTVCDRIGAEYLREWFPCDDKAIRSQEMIRGASQWRKKSYLAFLNLMNKPMARSTFIDALEKMTVDPSASCEIYVIASIAGGTGSGSFIPIALYAKRYIRRILGKDPIINAMIALPDIYADSQTPENKTKVYANAYAILRELNAINLVSRNYNAGAGLRKKAPIRFKIGDKNEPNVGLLFDASNKAYWTPEAAPFSQIFLLDRIPGLASIAAHDIVLANSLYTILCTEIGARFDSEFSNHELLRSQNNGGNAIYAGISTSQIRFPVESILDYLANRKTEEACSNEWLYVHRATENTIREREQQAKALRRRYNMKDDEYAKILVEQVRQLEEKNNDEIISILERCVYTYNKDGTKKRNGRVENYVKLIDKYIAERIEGVEDISGKFATDAGDLSRGAKTLERRKVADYGAKCKSRIRSYYKDCIERIRGTVGGAAESILNLDRKKEGIAGDDYSVVDKLLTIDKKHVHPVAAMVLLCGLRAKIGEKLAGMNIEDWPDLTKREVHNLPGDKLKFKAGKESRPNQKDDGIFGNGKSSYLEMGSDRFINIDNGASYSGLEDRTSTKADLKNVRNDAITVIEVIGEEAKAIFRRKVYEAVAKNLDILIAKYRNFFNRFAKEKDELAELTKIACKKDAGPVDSVINVFASEEDKKAIYKAIVLDGGPGTDAELAETDDIVGKSVFKTVYSAAVSEVAQDDSFNDKDSGAYRDLFGEMVKAYSESIRRSDAFGEIASYNAVEAIVAACGENPTDKQLSDAFKGRMVLAQELATPSLRVNKSGSTEKDLVAPSEIMVFMMTENTGRYLKKHADEFGLTIPADLSSEKSVISSCAEQFIRRFSGNQSARVAIVSAESKMPDQVLYCTGEIMDITPLRIAKFDELGDDRTYFKNYRRAIVNYTKYGTDMWNPHLSNGLHKRGSLPYMNEDMEKECDRRAVKALLNAFQKGYLVYTDSAAIGNNKYYFCIGKKKIVDNDKKWINRKSIAQIMAWIRNEDELVEKWSEEFDRDIQAQLNNLPTLAGESGNEISNLERQITNAPFMKMLNGQLYADESMNGGRHGLTAFEFAYAIKTTEEIGRDCDDAERVLDVLYDVFYKMCNHRTNADVNPELFIQVYTQQLGNFYEAVAKSEVVENAGEFCRDTFKTIVSWMNGAGAFKTIDMEFPMDESGRVLIDAPYDPETAKDDTKANLNSVLAEAKKPTKKKKADEGDDDGEAAAGSAEETAPKKSTSSKSTKKKTASKTAKK